MSIIAPVSYHLTENVGYQGRSNQASGAIYINSNDVVIDLGNFTLYNNSGATTTSSQTGIYVAAGKYNVVIRNGNITGFQDSGIQINENCDDVRIQNLTISQCVKQGIYLNGVADANATSQSMITNCVIDNSMIGRTNGVSTTAAYGLKMDNCLNILVNNSSFNRCETSTLAADAYGVLVSSSTNVVFNNCDASSNRGDDAYGFALNSTSNACSFINCSANGNWGEHASANGKGHGFYADTVNSCLWKVVQQTPMKVAMLAMVFTTAPQNIVKQINVKVLITGEIVKHNQPEKAEEVFTQHLEKVTFGMHAKLLARKFH